VAKARRRKAAAPKRPCTVATPLPSPAPPPADRDARVLLALDTIELRTARALIAKAASGRRLTKRELDSLPRLRALIERRAGRGSGQAASPDAAATVREVAERFGVTVRTVHNWKAEGMPGGEEGYDLAAIRAWHDERHPKAATSRSDLQTEKEKWDKEFRRMRFQLAEIDYRMKTGDLLDRGVVEADTREIVRAFRDELLGMAAALAPQLVGLDARQIKEAIDLRVRDALNGLVATLGGERAGEGSTE